MNNFSVFSGNFWANTSATGFGERHDVLTMTFASAVSNVSWLTQSFGSQRIVFNAYDSANNLLGTTSTTGSWVQTAFTFGNIARIDALQPTDTWGWAMDNLSFDSVAPVPVPAALPLLVVGLGALGIAGRRRKSH